MAFCCVSLHFKKSNTECNLGFPKSNEAQQETIVGVQEVLAYLKLSLTSTFIILGWCANYRSIYGLRLARSSVFVPEVVCCTKLVRVQIITFGLILCLAKTGVAHRSSTICM